MLNLLWRSEYGCGHEPTTDSESGPTFSAPPPGIDFVFLLVGVDSVVEVAI